MTSEFTVRDAYAKELARLGRANHPRIKCHPNGIEIDLWCDGNEVESERVLKITTRLRLLGNQLT